VRICHDPYARALLPSISFTLSKLVIDSDMYDQIGKGTTEFVTARERYIDDFLKACLSEGLDQVVILASLVSHQKILSKQKLGVGLCLFAIVLIVI
jgi:O-methyltransferase involved in polyketide biosynthesis